MSSPKTRIVRWLPVLLIATLLIAFSRSGGNSSTCGGACFLPDGPVALASRH